MNVRTIAIILVIILSYNINASSQGPAIAVAGITLRTLIGSAKNDVIEATKQAESSANNVINNALSSTLLLLDEIETAYRDQLDYTIAELIKAEGDIVNDIVYNIEKVTKDFQDGLYKDLSRDVNLLASTISGLPFYSKRPYIHNVQIPIVHSERRQPIVIVIEGRNLNAHKENNARLGTNSLSYKALSNTKAKLIINAEMLLENVPIGNDLFIDVDLELKRKKGFIFKTIESLDYKIPIRVIPNTVGTVEIIYTTADHEYRLQRFHVDKTVGCSVINRNGYTDSWNVEPIGEFEFISDNNFKVFKSRETDKCSQSSRVPSETCFITNRNIIPNMIYTNVTYYAEKSFSGRCSVRFHIECNSKSKTKTLVQDKNRTGELFYNKSYSTILDPNTTTIKQIKIIDIYGNETNFIARDIKPNESNKNGVFNVTWNTTSKAVLVEYLVSN